MMIVMQDRKAVEAGVMALRAGANPSEIRAQQAARVGQMARETAYLALREAINAYYKMRRVVRFSAFPAVLLSSVSPSSRLFLTRCCLVLTRWGRQRTRVRTATAPLALSPRLPISLRAPRRRT